MDYGVLCMILPIAAFCIFIKLCIYFEIIPKNLQIKPPEKVGFLDMAGNIARDFNKKD